MRIAVLDDYQGVATRYADWAGALPDTTVDVVRDHLEPDDLVTRISGCEIVVAMRERTPFPREVLRQLPRLRLLVTTGMRNAAIDVGAARDLGVVVTGTGSHGQSTSEHTWAMIMTLVRPIADYDRAIRSGGWQDSVAGDLAGRTLGVLGLGRLGSAVTRIAAAFDMTVTAWSPNLTAERAAAKDVRLVSRDALFAESDIVSVHMALADSTRGIVSREQLRAMRSDAFLVNTSRAGLVDQDALRTALEQRWIAGAALDVFDIEPLPSDHWLRTAPRTLLSPHMGYVSDAGYRIFYGDVVEDVTAFLDGAPVRVL